MQPNVFWKLIDLKLKSDLKNCIKEIANASPTVQALKVSVTVLEGSVLVNLVKPKKNQTSNHTLQMNSKTRWQSIKLSTVLHVSTNHFENGKREKSGKGVRRRVQDDSIAPTS